MLLALTSCTRDSGKDGNNEIESRFKVVTIEECEYLVYPYNSQIIHKANCKNCREFYKELFKRVQQ